MALTPEEAVLALAAQMAGAEEREENLEMESLEGIPRFTEYKEKINPAELLEKLKQGETKRENCISALKSASKDTQLDALGFAWIAMLADGIIDASEIELIEEVARPLGLEAEEVSDRAKETGHSTTYEASEIARKANVKNLIIGHFSQRYKNSDELLIEVKENFRNSMIAKPGLTIEFKMLNS